MNDNQRPPNKSWLTHETTEVKIAFHAVIKAPK